MATDIRARVRAQIAAELFDKDGWIDHGKACLGESKKKGLYSSDWVAIDSAPDGTHIPFSEAVINAGLLIGNITEAEIDRRVEEATEIERQAFIGKWATVLHGRFTENVVTGEGKMPWMFECEHPFDQEGVSECGQTPIEALISTIEIYDIAGEFPDLDEALADARIDFLHHGDDLNPAQSGETPAVGMMQD